MKTTFLTAAGLALLQLASALPRRQFRHGNSPDLAHRRAHLRRGVQTDVITHYTTVTGPQMVVWVNDHGAVISTETRHGNAASHTLPPSQSIYMPVAHPTHTTIPSKSAAVVHVSTPKASSRTVNPTTLSPAHTQAPTTAPPAPPAIPSPSPSSSPSRSSSSAAPAPAAGAAAPAEKVASTPNAAKAAGPWSGHGVAYDIIDGSGACKSQDAVNHDFTVFSDASLVRIYDHTCKQVQLVTAAAAAHGMRVLVGVSNADALNNLASTLDDILSQAGSNLDVVDTISIGNEYVNNGGDPNVILGALASARSLLAGRFSGSLVVIDTFNQHLAHHDLCAQSDYCAINCHAYFDTTQTSGNAGPYVAGVVQDVKNALGGKRVVVTESGWPHGGSDNGNAHAGMGDQDAAMASLKSTIPGDIILFQAFDAKYKSPGPLGVEQNFGMYGRS